MGRFEKRGGRLVCMKVGSGGFEEGLTQGVDDVGCH